MRNLKRALSLTLASVMLLGMMVVGSSAASYPDVDREDNIEAIEVLQAVQVMRGDDKGNFNPDSPVTRSEMAVIMALLLDLDYDYYASICPFTDVPEWARPYVGACYANKIVAGYSASTYGANDGVTAVQASAMMMRALGYFQTDADYADGFETATVRQGTRIGIYTGVGSSANVAMTRNQVAQMALNALQCTMVDARKNSADITVGSGDTAVTITGNVEYVVRTSRENFAYAINDTETSSNGVNGVSGATIELGEQLYNGDLRKESFEKGDNIFDVFGSPATRWTYKTSEIGVYADEADATYTAEVASKDIYKDLGLSSTIGSTYLFIYEDGITYTGDVTEISRNSDDKLGGNGTLVKAYKCVVVNESSVHDAVIISVMNTYLAQVDGAYNSDSGELELDMLSTTAPNVDTTLEDDDFGGLSNFSDGDYILVNIGSADGSAAGQEIMTIAAAEVLTGEVSKYTVGSNVTVDGDPYKYSPNFHDNVNGNDVDHLEYEVGKDSRFVLDSYGYIIGLDEVNGANSYVYIDEFRKEGNYSRNEVYRGDAYFTDGTVDDIVLNKIDGKSITDVDGSAGTYVITDGNKTTGWYKYTTTSDNKYNLTSQPNVGTGSVTSGDKVVENKVNKVIYGTDDSEYLRAYNSTAFIIRDKNNKIYTYTGVQEVATVTAGTDTKVYAVNDGGYASYVFVDVGEGSLKGASTASGDIIFILSTEPAIHHDEDGEYYTYDAILNGKIIKKTEEGAVRTDDNTIFNEVGLYAEVYYDESNVSEAPIAEEGLDNDDAGFAYVEDVAITQKGQSLVFGPEGNNDSVRVGGPIFLIDKEGKAERKTANQLANQFNGDNAEKQFTGIVWATFGSNGATGVYVQEADVPGNEDEIDAVVDLSGKIISTKGATFTGSVKRDGSVDLTSLRQVRAGDEVGTITFNISGEGVISNVNITMNPGVEERVVSVKIITTDNGTEVVHAEVAVAEDGTGTPTNNTPVDTVPVATVTMDGEGKIDSITYDGRELTEDDAVIVVDEAGNKIAEINKSGDTVTVVPEGDTGIAGEGATIYDGDNYYAVDAEDGTVGTEPITTYEIGSVTDGEIDSSEATFSVTPNKDEAPEGANVILTVALSAAVPEGKVVTVTFTAPEGIDPVVFEAGEQEKTVTITVGEADVDVDATAAQTDADDDGNEPDLDPTANVIFELTTPEESETNTIEVNQTEKTVAVNVANATESVVIAVTLGEGQSIAITGSNANDVTEDEGALTVNTSDVAEAGGEKTFTLTVSKEGEADIDYVVTVTVAGNEDDGGEEEGGEATAATYVVTAPTDPSEEAGDLDLVRIGGLDYSASSEENAELAAQIKAWVDGFNADEEMPEGWTAAVGEEDNDGNIVFTYEGNETYEEVPEGFPVEGVTWVDDAESATLTLENPTDVNDILKSSKVVVSIGGKEYQIDAAKTELADQIAAWIAAFNEENSETATAEYDEEASEVTFTAVEAGSVEESLFTNLGLSGGDFTNGEDANVEGE